ncbi:prepilin-type N-terminal cleavage/methylation domain-containing protein [Candidatus Gottesmanbacteria bacterium]|nr:prepilin-type N-terminal cleavage/methylation domain-containing protein [Candidatus Gottesmanbacteria bacterium]
MNHKKGFTLIELLIVIALLGALAVGLLAAIDPFEQLKKGRDTSTRNTTSEFYNAVLRFYATNANLPWNVGGATTTFSAQPMTSGTVTASISTLITAGELKNKFYTLAGVNNLARIYITSPSTESMIACFIPESKSFKQDLNVVFNNIGSSTTGCVAETAGGSTSCYWCIQ